MKVWRVYKLEVLTATNKVHVLKLSKNVDAQLAKSLTRQQIRVIIEEDSDVFDADSGKLVLSFRKNKIQRKNIDAFFTNVIRFARNTSTLRRGAGSGKPVMSNIFGFYDKWSASHYLRFKKFNFMPKLQVRECMFNMRDPIAFTNAMSLIEDIDALYKELAPKEHNLQLREAEKNMFSVRSNQFHYSHNKLELSNFCSL